MEGLEQAVRQNDLVIPQQTEEQHTDYMGNSAERSVNIGIVKAVADLNLSERARRRIKDQMTDYMVEVAGDIHVARQTGNYQRLENAVVEFIEIGRLPNEFRDVKLYHQLKKEVLPLQYGL